MSVTVVPRAVPVLPAEPSTRSRYRYYVLGVLALIGLLNTMDQSILSVTAPAIQADLHLDDAQVGIVSSAFVVVYGLAALPSGYWVDRFSRRALVGAGVLVWSLLTLLTGFAHTYPQLLAARSALGIGEATTVPAGVSMLGDDFGKGDRGRAAGVFQAALQVGLAVGLVVGGLVAARLGWRATFSLAAAPGLVLATLALFLREPLRGAAEAAGPQRRAIPSTGLHGIGRLLRTRSFVAAVLANACVLFATTGVGGFIAIYVVRRFGLDLAQVGAMVGAPLLVGSLLGNALGGWLVDRRGRRSARAPLEVAAIAAALAALGLVATFSAASPPQFVGAFLAATLAGNLGLPGLLAVNQNLVLPSLRGSATALQQLAGNVLGRAGGLLLIGLVANQLQSLGQALLLLPAGALVLAALFAMVGLPSLPGEVARMEHQWAQWQVGADL